MNTNIWSNNSISIQVTNFLSHPAKNLRKKIFLNKTKKTNKTPFKTYIRNQLFGDKKSQNCLVLSQTPVEKFKKQLVVGQQKLLDLLIVCIPNSAGKQCITCEGTIVWYYHTLCNMPRVGLYRGVGGKEEIAGYLLLLCAGDLSWCTHQSGYYSWFNNRASERWERWEYVPSNFEILAATFGYPAEKASEIRVHQPK